MKYDNEYEPLVGERRRSHWMTGAEEYAALVMANENIVPTRPGCFNVPATASQKVH